MSLDFAWSKNALDFTRIPKGCAIIERAERPLAGVEINAPLFRNGRVLTKEGQEFRDLVYSCGDIIEVEAVPAPPIQAKRKESKRRKSSLEDWL